MSSSNVYLERYPTHGGHWRVTWYERNAAGEWLRQERLVPAGHAKVINLKNDLHHRAKTQHDVCMVTTEYVPDEEGA